MGNPTGASIVAIAPCITTVNNKPVMTAIYVFNFVLNVAPNAIPVRIEL